MINNYVFFEMDVVLGGIKVEVGDVVYVEAERKHSKAGWTATRSVCFIVQYLSMHGPCLIWSSLCGPVGVAMKNIYNYYHTNMWLLLLTQLFGNHMPNFRLVGPLISF